MLPRDPWPTKQRWFAIAEEIIKNYEQQSNWVMAMAMSRAVMITNSNPG